MTSGVTKQKICTTADISIHDRLGATIEPNNVSMIARLPTRNKSSRILLSSFRVTATAPTIEMTEVNARPSKESMIVYLRHRL